MATHFLYSGTCFIDDLWKTSIFCSTYITSHLASGIILTRSQKLAVVSPFLTKKSPINIMQIIESNEMFEDEKGDGNLKFHHLSLLIRKDGQLYTAKCAYRFSANVQPSFNELHDVKLLDTEDRGPKVKPTWTVLDSPHDYYVKSPEWRAYELPRADLEQHIHDEIEICELLKLHPHPNVALYAGCGVTNGRVCGLSFKKYTSTLAQKVNPHSTNKEHFLTMDRRLSADDDNENATQAFLDGVLAGVRHLHSLGLVHNDINPSNIMFEEDGTPVIIDFGSCTKIGESMKNVGTTHGWCDFSVETVVETNDLNAVAELRTWLLGSSADEFLFLEG